MKEDLEQHLEIIPLTEEGRPLYQREELVQEIKEKMEHIKQFLAQKNYPDGVLGKQCGWGINGEYQTAGGPGGVYLKYLGE